MALVNSPPDFELPLEAATLHTPDAAPHSLDVVLAFFTRRADFEPAFAQLARRLQPAGGLWIAWPKKSSGVATDLNENVIREIGVAAGLVDNKVCAVTDVWSGLRFVYRLKDRPKQ